MPQPPTTDHRVCVARIGAPHGIRGEVRLHAFTEDPMTVAKYGTLEAEDGSRRFAIDKVRPGNGFLVARLAGINDRNAAEQVKNCRLFVPRDRLPELADADDFYHTDLIGLSVVDRAGNDLGTVAAIHNFGAGDLVEVKPVSGQTVLLPFTKAVVPVVDLAARRLVADPPDGFIPPPTREDAQSRKAGTGSGASRPDPKATSAERHTGAG
ncbi:MAG TPA: ribosome maturation factor RimM [Xanthobacteraceae bacterium]|nr:ribosome maturation factor RimM [Xanthobacteraceae bacterium]